MVDVFLFTLLQHAQKRQRWEQDRNGNGQCALPYVVTCTRQHIGTRPNKRRATENANKKTKKPKVRGVGRSCSPPSRGDGEVNTNMTHEMQT